MRLLSREEIEELTEYKRPDKQCQALAAMGIPHHRCPRTGRPKVLYEDLKPDTQTATRGAEPRWDLAS